RVGSPARASRRGGSLALGGAQLAPSLGQMSLELAHLLRGLLGRRLALRGVSPQRFDFLGEALALRPLLGVPGFGLLALRLGLVPLRVRVLVLRLGRLALRVGGL